ncbi:AraC family transcriptional regulator [Escherichia coli]|uniref:helix-turn-helix transcriptional regulator n=1 Tax=Escherichia coli TaxID=562 RepID=UPI00191AE7FB|nr:helix-turn-helix transcriptional regulator [Escherichia coli]CAD6175992.1 AraC family transcriptional regulator [Escherichia coli]
MRKINNEDSPNAFSPGSVTIKKITVSKFLVIYTCNCDLCIQNKNGAFFFPKGRFIFIGRNMSFSCQINKLNSEKRPYKAIRLNKNEVLTLINILKSICVFHPDEYMHGKESNNKIICVEDNNEWAYIFNRIVSSRDSSLKILKLAYMISRMGITQDIMLSLISSALITFTDKIRELIENNISIKWRLSMIADKFNLTEVSVRKRLEAEGTSFSKLLLDIRMNRALQLLLQSELQIPQISRSVGFSGLSYFIKSFRNYFGITPKQFIIYFRC